MEFFFVLHRSLLTLVGRRALVCFDKVSITLTSARKLKLCSEQLSSAVERSFLYKYIFFLLLRYLPFTRVLLRRDSSFWGFKRWLPFFLPYLYSLIPRFFFSPTLPLLTPCIILSKGPVWICFFKLVLLFYLTSSIIQNLPQKNAVSRNCL